MGKVYVYLRVSTDKQETDNQRFEINNWCRSRCITPTDWIEEIMSGTKNAKSGKISPMVKRLKPGDTLIVSEISRISRSLLDIMDILKRCLEQGVKVYAIKEGFILDNSIQSKVIAFAFGLAAEIERNLISQRIREALARKKAEGVKLGRPVGSKKKNPILAIHAESIQQMLAEGKTQADIARKLKVHRHTVKDWISQTHP